MHHYTRMNEPASAWQARLWFQIISVTLWLIFQQGAACVQSFLRDFMMSRVLVLCSVHVKKVLVIITYCLNFLLQPARNKSTWHLVSWKVFCVLTCKKSLWIQSHLPRYTSKVSHTIKIWQNVRDKLKTINKTVFGHWLYNIFKMLCLHFLTYWLYGFHFLLRSKVNKCSNIVPKRRIYTTNTGPRFKGTLSKSIDTQPGFTAFVLSFVLNHCKLNIFCVLDCW